MAREFGNFLISVLCQVGNVSRHPGERAEITSVVAKRHRRDGTENEDDSFPAENVTWGRSVSSLGYFQIENSRRWIFRNCSCFWDETSLRTEQIHPRALLWPLILPSRTFSAYKRATLKMSHWRGESDESISFKHLLHDATLSMFMYIRHRNRLYVTLWKTNCPRTR